MYLETHDKDGSIAHFINRTGIECSKCADDVGYTDEVFLLTVVSPMVAPEGVLYQVLTSDDGDYLYEPQVFDIICWEEVEEDARNAAADVPPVLEPRAILDCSICESGIMQGETMALATFGEIHCSQRAPNRKSTNTFKVYSNEPRIVCLSCLRYIDEDVVTMWQGEVQQGDECREGTHQRCWRYGCFGGDYCMAKHGP